MNIITTTQALTDFCNQLCDQDAAGFVTIDTEFVRRDTYYPILSLIQIAGSQTNAIIDPLAEGIDISPLKGLLQDSNIIKVFHAARQDIEIILHYLDCIPTPLFDTQVAAMALGHGDSVGYNTLVKSYLNVELDKSQRFTDWNRRPLSDKQLSYALHDVTYLREVYSHIAGDLKRLQRGHWTMEEMQILQNEETYRLDPMQTWRKIRVRNNNPRFLARVQELAAFRENYAKEQNVPRTRVLSDAQILELAAENPKNCAGIAKVRSMKKALCVDSPDNPILLSLSAANDRPIEHCPQSKKRPKKVSADADLVAMLKLWLTHVSQKHQLAAKLISSTDDIEQIAALGETDVPALKGWRREVFGKMALDIRNGKVGMAYKEGKLHPVAV
ncbi:MAG: ribonuclease D [Alphaproteobacteria bacterium]